MILEAVTLIGLVIGGFIAMYLIFFGCIYGAMYMRIPTRKLKKIIALGKLDETKHVYDLGAGFGRIGFTAAESGAHVTLVEIDRAKTFWIERVIQSNIASPMKRFHRFRVDLIKGNIFGVDLTDADVIYAYLSPPLMASISHMKMKQGAVLISVQHPIKNWNPEYTDAKDKIYLYRIGNT